MLLKGANGVKDRGRRQRLWRPSKEGPQSADYFLVADGRTSSHKRIKKYRMLLSAIYL